MDPLHPLVITVLAIVIGLIVIPTIIFLSKRLGWYDLPDGRKWHSNPVPATGGVGIALTLFAALLIMPQGRAFILSNLQLTIGFIILAIIGILDDRKGVPPRIRFMIQILLATWLAHSGVRITNLGGIMGLEEISLTWQYVFTVVMIVGSTNAYNLVDGIDGLSGSFALVIASMLLVLGWSSGGTIMAPFLLALCGAMVAFLIFNWNPAKVFMGDGGTLPIGFALAAIGVSTVEQAGAIGTLDRSLVITLTASCFMGMVIDTLRVFVERINKGYSPFRPDRTHMHHWFVRNFYTHAQSVRMMVASLVLTGLITYFLNGFLGITAILIFQALFQLAMIAVLRLRRSFRLSYRLVRSIERTIG